jgi:pyruvate,water dikinase
MTPATWSMVQVFMSDAMATASVPPYRGWGRIGGRVYLNVSVMSSLSGPLAWGSGGSAR